MDEYCPIVVIKSSYRLIQDYQIAHIQLFNSINTIKLAVYKPFDSLKLIDSCKLLNSF